MKTEFILQKEIAAHSTAYCPEWLSASCDLRSTLLRYPRVGS